MNIRKLYLVISVLVLLTTFSFVWVHQTKPMHIQLPANFPSPVYDLTVNPLTEEGFALGRKLFYEPLLSRDSTISCGSCHQQEAAFIQAGHDFSHGVDNKHGKRNSLPIFNGLFYKTFFWDGGVHNLDMVAVNPIEKPIEMDETMPNVLKKLNNSMEYRMLFKKAFNVDSVTSKELLQAFSQFMVAMISANSKYDKYIRNEGVDFSKEEKEGLRIYQQKCSSCHATDLFTDGSYKNNGITNDFRFDKGRQEITLDENDEGKFKVPTLRNIEYTAPYMHNGSIATLEQVLDHYTNGMKASKTIDTIFVRNDGTFGIDLTIEEKKNLITFLKTLSDKEFITNKKFAAYQ